MGSFEKKRELRKKETKVEEARRVFEARTRSWSKETTRRKKLGAKGSIFEEERRG